MKKLILWWLFGTDDIDDYLDLLVNAKNHTQEKIRLIDDHIETLKRNKEALERNKEYTKIILKLIKVCENHGINVDTEIKSIQVDDEGNVYETVG
jgi:hypothetical protein